MMWSKSASNTSNVKQKRFRGKMRSIIFIGCAITAVLILYRTLGEVTFVSAYHKTELVDVQESTQLQHREKPPNVEPNEDANENVNKFFHHNSDEFLEKSWHKSNPWKEKEIAEPEVPHINSVNSVKKTQVWDQLSSGKGKRPLLAHKLVHLDLKGAPPTINYFTQLFPLLKKLGVTGLLIEYEDMFPYWGALRDLSAYNAYTVKDIEQLTYLAKSYGFTIVPLVQTFGHMEFALKLSSFMSMREISAYPQVICPSHNNSMVLITSMIDQILALHPNIKWLHIGSDEVYYLGECDRCRKKMEDMHWSKDNLFVEHVKSIAKYVKSKYGIQPIMWDDMFRQIPQEVIHISGIWQYVEIMAWRYKKDISSELPHEVWMKYGKIFSGVWIASAFKGATGPSQYITEITHHLENHISWLQIVETYHEQVPFKGIAITGWQRYDHFAVLCELLPASIPSLAINLIYLQTSSLDPELVTKAVHVLDCNRPLNLELDTSDIVRCSYPGGRIFEGVQQLYIINQERQVLKEDNYIAGWLNQYNIDTQFSSPALLEQAINKLALLQHNLTVLHEDMERALSEVYDHYTVEEWLHLNVLPLEQEVSTQLVMAKKMMMQEVWPRRPLQLNKTDTKLKNNYPKPMNNY